MDDTVSVIAYGFEQALSTFRIPILIACGFLAVSIGVVAVLELLRSFDRFPFLKGKNGKKIGKSNDGD